MSHDLKNELKVELKIELKVRDTLKKLMTMNGETLISVAQQTGVPKSTIADWLTNRTPNPLQAVKVAKHFGVSLHFLLFGCEDTRDIRNGFMDELLDGTFEVSIKRLKSK